MKEIIVLVLPLMLTLLPLIAFFSIIMCTEDNKLHLWFPLQMALIVITVGISFHWFVCGKEFVFNYGSFWKIVERGTLDAISSVMEIIGISCLFLGWAYSEREKVTLGHKQIEIVRYVYGHGYGLSLIIHFCATILCWILLKCGAREATLWAFATVLLGCVPQALICIRIVINRDNREEKSLELWKNEVALAINKFETIQKMAQYLNDADVYRNANYRETMGFVIAKWLHSCYTNNSGMSRENIRKSSAIYHKIADRIPKEERALFEEDILQYVCRFLNDSDQSQEVAITLLCAGYIRYLFSQGAEEMTDRINRTMYYANHEDNLFSEFGSLMRSLNYGLEWYQFLTQRMGLSKHAVVEQSQNSYMHVGFKELVLSIFENDGENASRNIRIAWEQVYPRGEQT